jgi:sigma-B regulation protein RsbU (phosphoserine phosphatase)
MEEVNRQLCRNVYSGQFVTLLIAILDLERDSVEVVTAGHPPPLVGNGAAFAPLATQPQLVLGIDEDVTYETQRFDLKPGSSLLLYTDGVTDVQSAAADRFTIEGVQNSLYGRFESAQTLLDTVLDAVNTFRDGAPLADDLTLVAIQLQPTPIATAKAPATAAAV